MLKKDEVEGKIHGLKVTPTSLSLSHLFFVDDIILFARVNDEEVYELIAILNKFTGASGQLINIKKLGHIFGKKVQLSRQRQVL